MSVLKTVYADKYGVRVRVDGECAIRVNDDGQISQAMGIVYNVLEAALLIMPKERFSAFEVKTAAALAIERVNRGGDFLILQIFGAPVSHPAVPTPQIAAIGENHPLDEGPVFTCQ